MRRLSVILGFSLTLLPVIAFAQEKTLYERVVELVEFNHSFTKSELTVEKFVKKIYKGPIQDLNVDQALRNEYETCTPDELNIGDCSTPVFFVQDQIAKQAFIRELGRDLQQIATSYEIPVHTHPDRPFSLTTKFESIVRLWQSGTDATFRSEGKLVEAKQLDWDALESDVEALKGALESLKVEENEKMDYEKFDAALWRYRYGVQEVEKENENSTGCSSDDEKGDGTELQYTKTRFCDVEEALNQILQAARQQLEDDDDAVILFSTENLMEDIHVWVRSDDAGLFRDMPLSSVLPSLDCTNSKTDPPALECKNGVILGGIYPYGLKDEPVIDEPEPGRGLCSHPLAQKGYLCRPIEQETCPTGEDPDSIQLTRCTESRFKENIPLASTVSGPNICELGGWNEKPDEEVPAECRNCNVTVSCGCNESQTSMKDVEGNIVVCISNEGIPATYSTIRQLAHAQTLCNQPPSTPLFSNGAQCCTKEYEAYRLACAAAYSDGNFDGTDITVESCAALLSNDACTNAGYDSCMAEEPGDEEIEAVKEAMKENRADVVTACMEDADRMDPRAASMIYSLPMACTPECISKYKNTVGNNICFAGECIEQSLEAHRLVPGRVAAVSADEAYPWDACIAPDEDLKNTNVGILPAGTSNIFPLYQPGKLALALDSAYCQMNGLPALTPPVLCATDPRRTLQYPLDELLEFNKSLKDEVEEFELPSGQLMEIAPSIGTRIGTTLYTDYLERSSKTLADLTSFIVRELKQIEKTKFPDAMCPRSAEGIPLPTDVQNYCEILNPPEAE